MSHLRHLAAEILKAFEKAADGLGAILAVEVFAAEVVVLGAVAQHVEGGGEHEAATARMAFLAPRRALMRRNWARK